MATRKILPELSAEGLELERRAAEGQPGPVGALQAFGQIRGINWHPSSIRRLGAVFARSSAAGRGRPLSPGAGRTTRSRAAAPGPPPAHLARGRTRQVGAY